MWCVQVPDPDQEAAMQLSVSERSSLLPASAAAAGAGAAAGAAAAGVSSQQPSKRQRLYQAPEVRRPFLYILSCAATVHPHSCSTCALPQVWPHLCIRSLREQHSSTWNES